jgi:hypothetical protein
MNLEFYTNYKHDETIETISKAFGLKSKSKNTCRSNGLRRWCFTGTTKTLGWFLWRIEQEKIELE